jgi:hypothetical protein
VYIPDIPRRGSDEAMHIVAWGGHLETTLLITLAASTGVVVRELSGDFGSVDVVGVERTGLGRAWTTWCWVLLAAVLGGQHGGVNPRDSWDPWEGESAGSENRESDEGLHFDVWKMCWSGE